MVGLRDSGAQVLLLPDEGAKGGASRYWCSGWCFRIEVLRRYFQAEVLRAVLPDKGAQGSAHKGTEVR
jgi:hypothetical protein